MQIQRRESRKLGTQGQRPLYLLAEAIPGIIYIKFSHHANNHGTYSDGFRNSLIDDKDGHIPSPLIMFTCTALYHAVVEWQKNRDVHPTSSKSKLKVDRYDHSNYFNYKNDDGKNASCRATMGRELLISGWGCRHVYNLDEYLEHTTGELPTEDVSKHSCDSQASDPTGRDPDTCQGHQGGSSAC